MAAQEGEGLWGGSANNYQLKKDPSNKFPDPPNCLRCSFSHAPGMSASSAAGSEDLPPPGGASGASGAGVVRTIRMEPGDDLYPDDLLEKMRILCMSSAASSATVSLLEGYISAGILSPPITPLETAFLTRLPANFVQAIMDAVLESGSKHAAIIKCCERLRITQKESDDGDDGEEEDDDDPSATADDDYAPDVRAVLVYFVENVPKNSATLEYFRERMESSMAAAIGGGFGRLELGFLLCEFAGPLGAIGD